MNTYRKKNFRKRGYSGRPHRRTADSFHQPLPPDQSRLPYARHTLTKPDVEAVVEALLSGTLTQGKELERFESLLAKLTHSEHAIAVSSGTAAIHGALACLKLEPEDEIITSTLNFCAVANMVALCGAKPVLVDCHPETLTIDPAGVAAAINDNTKAVFANNYAGHPSDLNAIRELCDERGLVLLEDACHGLGGKYRGHYVGNQADITCFSFHPAKAITTCEGGAVTTNNRAIAEWLRQFRHHGIQKTERFFQTRDETPPFYQEVQFQGMNYRLSELHAALGRSQLTRLDRHIERRRSIAQVYFQKLGGVEEIKLPHVAEWADHAYSLFPIQFVGELEEKRNEIFEGLQKAGIEVQFHYTPIHRMPFFAGLIGGGADRFPNAEAFYRRGMSLPMFPDLSYKDIERVVETLLKLAAKILGRSEASLIRKDGDGDSADAKKGKAEPESQGKKAGESDSGNAKDGGNAKDSGKSAAKEKPDQEASGEEAESKSGGSGLRLAPKSEKADDSEKEKKAAEKPRRRPRRSRSAAKSDEKAEGVDKGDDAKKDKDDEKKPKRTRATASRRSGGRKTKADAAKGDADSKERNKENDGGGDKEGKA